MAKRILIADDSVTIQKAFAMTFGAEEVTLMAARSADEGLTMARQSRPDLVIADVSMPGRSGYELCAAIKADGALRGMPVYILASAQQPYDEAKGRQAGADGHLLKPFESGALIDKIREAASRPSVVVEGARPAPIAARAPGAMAPPPAASMDDEYGEISVDTPTRDTGRPTMATPMVAVPPARPVPASPAFAPAARATVGPAPAAPPAAAPGSGAGMRPSLIPGVRPGAVAPARPGMQPMRPVGPTGPGAAPPAQRAPMPAGRTLMGLPAANVPIPGSMRPAVPAGGVPAGVRPAVPGPASQRPLAPPPAAVSALVDQKMAALAAKGPEYEAIAKLSREIIEQIVWEVVPELAEAIIREHVEKRGRI